MPGLFAGIDGGQSSTLAVLGTASEEIGRGTGPPADLVGEPRESTRGVVALAAALDSALDGAAVARGTTLEAVVAGISGFDAGLSRPPDLGARARRMHVVHDTEIAHAGALDGAAGIVVIAGTGSVALGNDAPGGPFVRAGGWGYFFGDEGGALWLARTALRRAMACFDRGEPSALAEAARLRFARGSLRDIQHAFAHGEIARPELAAFASDVLGAANGGDRDAATLRASAAIELASLVRTVDRRLEAAATRLVSYAGGLFDDRAFTRAFGMALSDSVPHAKLLQPVRDPAGGALVLARALRR